MKSLFLFTAIVLSAQSVTAANQNIVAECSALNNNFNHKYGAKIMDKGATYDTVLDDKLYSASSTYQMVLMAKVSYTEKWKLNTYEQFVNSHQNSSFFSYVLFYDTIAMQKLTDGQLLYRMNKKQCFDKFQAFAKSPGIEDKILNNFDKIVPYIEKMRGF